MMAQQCHQIPLFPDLVRPKPEPEPEQMSLNFSFGMPSAKAQGKTDSAPWTEPMQGWARIF
jgi:hypothetical protein